MARTVEFVDGARLDFDEAFEWYAQRSLEAAVGFAISVDDAIEKIREHAARFPIIEAGFRYCPLRRYPFRIVFREDPDRLVLLAIAHYRRDPGYWRNRT
jgi:plasmid stabilization system protein ParE